MTTAVVRGFKLALLSAVLLCCTCSADIFVMPFNGDLYLEPLGGEAAASTVFGIGTSPADFVPFFSGLPNSPSPDKEVLAGFYSAGQSVIFGMQTVFNGATWWAFSNGSDRASLVAFTDLDNSLGLGGKITQQTGADTWVLHLDDAASFLVDDDDNDVLMQIRIAPTTVAPLPEPSVLIPVAVAFSMLSVIAIRRRRRLHRVL